MDRFDPVTLEVLWQRLIGIVDEMAAVVVRTSFSTVVGAANDFACELLDAHGDALAHATRSMPVFNLTLPTVCKELLRRFGPPRPGDVFITNDPWLCAGHLPDIAIVTPIFRHERHVGFAGSIAHCADIGGTLESYRAREVYDEGLELPPLRLVDRGAPVEAVFEIVRRNVRVPEQVIGDFHAQMAANQLGGERIAAYLDEYGLDTLDGIARAIQSRSELAMRREIAALADGEYWYTADLDEIGDEGAVRVRLRVAGDELEVAYIDAPPQQERGGVNCTLSYTVAHTTYALKCALTPTVPINQGDFRPLRVRAPEGSVLNARRPASVNMRTKTGWHLAPAVFGALAQVAPERVQAAGGAMSYLTVYGHDAGGRAFHSYFFCGGGMAASARSDGASACIYPSSASNIPVELFEVRVPMLVQRKELIRDSGGPGARRGGLGQRVVLSPLPGYGRPINVGLQPHRHVHAPFGLFGAHAGSRSRVAIDGRELTPEELKAGKGFLTVSADEEVLLDTAGGGGFGDPRERDREALARDVEEGLVSDAAAAEGYAADKRASPARGGATR